MQDPKIMQAVGQNPQAPVMMAAMMAHISEHVAFEYRKQIEEQMGIPLPKMGEEMSPEIEVQMSQLMAQASQKLLQKDQAEAAQQQAQQAAQDPIVQMQQKELEIKQGELDLKKQKLSVDSFAKVKQLKIEESRIAAQKEIAGAQLGAKITNDKETNEGKMRLEGMRLGAQITKDRQQSQPQPQPEKPTKGE
jgi:membrane protease subunit (stomatin/prohibitin family)